MHIRHPMSDPDDRGFRSCLVCNVLFSSLVNEGRSVNNKGHVYSEEIAHWRGVWEVTSANTARP